MTAVRLRDGGLWVSAPIAPTRQCLRLLDELGKVAYLVIPSTALEHKASLAEFSRTYPKAEVWVTPGQAPPIYRSQQQPHLRPRSCTDVG